MKRLTLSCSELKQPFLSPWDLKTVQKGDPWGLRIAAPRPAILIWCPREHEGVRFGSPCLSETSFPGIPTRGLATAAFWSAYHTPISANRFFGANGRQSQFHDIPTDSYQFLPIPTVGIPKAPPKGIHEALEIPTDDCFRLLDDMRPWISKLYLKCCHKGNVRPLIHQVLVLTRHAT